MPSSSPESQPNIELAGGAQISLDTDYDGNVLLGIMSPDGDATLVSLMPAVAAYLSGQMAVRSGVRFV